MHPIKARRMKGSLCENKEVSHQGSPQNSAQVSAKQAEVGAAQPAGHRRCASLTPFLRKADCCHLVSPPSLFEEFLHENPPCHPSMQRPGPKLTSCPDLPAQRESQRAFWGAQAEPPHFNPFYPILTLAQCSTRTRTPPSQGFSPSTHLKITPQPLPRALEMPQLPGQKAQLRLLSEVKQETSRKKTLQGPRSRSFNCFKHRTKKNTARTKHGCWL